MLFVSTASLKAFDPRVADGKISGERLSALRNCANLFNFGGRTVYRLQAYDGKIVAMEEKAQPSVLKTLVKVLAVATVVLPLLACLGALVYHHLNKIKLGFTEKQIKAFIQKFDEAWKSQNIPVLKAIIKNPIFEFIDQESLFNFISKCIDKNHLELIKALLKTSVFKKIPLRDDNEFDVEHLIDSALEGDENVPAAIELLLTPQGIEFLRDSTNADNILLAADELPELFTAMKKHNLLQDRIKLFEFFKKLEQAFLDEDFSLVQELIKTPIFESISEDKFFLMVRNCVVSGNLEIIKCIIKTSNFKKITLSSEDALPFVDNDDFYDDSVSEKMDFVSLIDTALSLIDKKTSVVVELLLTPQGREFLDNQDNLSSIYESSLEHFPELIQEMKNHNLLTDDDIRRFEQSFALRRDVSEPAVAEFS